MEKTQKKRTDIKNEERYKEKVRENEGVKFKQLEAGHSVYALYMR